MPRNPEIPLHLYEVLEEEFISLHGSIPAGNQSGPAPTDEVIVVEIADGEGRSPRLVEAARDWWFRGGHVKDPSGFAAELLQFSDSAGAGPARVPEGKAQDEWVRRNLTQYLRDNVGRKLLTRLVEPPLDRGDVPAETIEDALNRLLNDSELYDASRFADEWLSPATRGLVEQHDAASGGFFGDALRHFNRLLLEEAFPRYLERMTDVRLAAIYRRLHAREQSALCLSGGGIRSGTFALGILQGLARHDLLRKFDYLSTVSGGGYMGGWLTAWLHRHPDGIEGVTSDLKNANPVRKIDPDVRPLQYLRTYSNFLTPKVGLLTADTWTFAGIYLRNFLLNWLVFIPLLMAALMIPRLLVTVTLLQPVKPLTTVAAFVGEQQYRRLHPGVTDEVVEKNSTPVVEAELERGVRGLVDVPPRSRVVYETKPWYEGLFGRPGWNFYPRHALLLLGFAFGVWALGFIGFNRPGVRELLRERSKTWRTRTDQRGFLVYCLVPLLFSAVALTTYWAWAREEPTKAGDILLFLAFGLAFAFGGWLIASAVLRRIFHVSEISVAELLGLCGAGLAGGFIFWLISLMNIGNPVIGYGLAPSARDGSEPAWALPQPPLFRWTDWTSWSWLDWRTELYVCLALPIFLLVFWAGTTLVVGFTSRSRRFNDEDREWWARLGAWLLIASIAWVVGNALVIFGPLALLESPKLLAAIGGASGLVSILVGKSAHTPARGEGGGGKSKGFFGLDLLGVVLPVLGAIFLACFVALVSLATTGLTRGVAMIADERRCAKFGPGPGSPCESFRVLDPRLRGWFTNIPGDDPRDVAPPPPPSGAAPGPTDAPAASRTPASAPAMPDPNRGFRDYVTYITPVVEFAPTPTPAPAASPAPAPTPCTPACPTAAELAAARDADEAKRTDSFEGAKVVHMNVLHHTSLWLTLAQALLLFGLGMLLGRRINLNIFSLHGGYRDRLIRAFLGASRPHGTRRPNPFTGFDPADDLHMHELRPALLDEGDLLASRKLTEALLNEKNPLSKYLLDKKLLENVRAQEKTGPLVPSPALTAALRTDLNAILEDERLYMLVLAEDRGQMHGKYVASVEDPGFDAGEFAQSLLLKLIGESKRARRVWRSLKAEPRIRDAAGEMENAAEGPTPDASAVVEAIKKLKGVQLRNDYHILLNRLVLEGSYPRLLKAGAFPPPPYRLLHVVNTTLNLVGGDKLAWQQRKAEPFSISPLHSGCFRLGYRKSKDYGGRDGGGITIGTAAATSGAAASSNMGYYTTSPVISLLLTLFNVRLGWWLGNPGPAGDTTYHLAAPKYSVEPVLYEAFGLTNDRSKYVYLTDGGHFENLAVYEMVLRRSRFIVVSDAAADEDYHFTDLANAVRKIRIDLGVTIDFPCVKIYDKATADKKGPGMYWALGRIRYSCVDRVRPGDGTRGLAGDEDIRGTQGAQKVYPQLSTNDLTGPHVLTAKLVRAHDAVSAHIGNLFTREAQERLAGYNPPGLMPEPLRQVLFAELNRLITGPSIYDPTAFAQVRLSAETRRLLSGSPLDAEPTWLNRRLLEDAYPEHIARRYFEDADDGILLYIKPAVYGNEPRDVLEYKESFPAFPHQSTADQFFDEPQFESYRELGLYIMRTLCGESPSEDRPECQYNELNLPELVKKAHDELERQCGRRREDAKDAVNRRLAELLRGMAEGAEGAASPEGRPRGDKAEPGENDFFGWVKVWLDRRYERQESADRQEREGEARRQDEVCDSSCGDARPLPEGGAAGSE